MRKAVKNYGSQAFVIEAGPSAGMASYTLPSSVIDHDAQFARMTTVVDADDLTEDATFFASPKVPIESSRTLYIVNGALSSASVGVLGFIALAWGARRRRRV